LFLIVSGCPVKALRAVHQSSTVSKVYWSRFNHYFLFMWWKFTMCLCLL